MKVTEEQNKTALEILKANPKSDKVWINHKGEYFTNFNLAQGSIKDFKKQLAVVKEKSDSNLTDEEITALSVAEITELVKAIDGVEALISLVETESINQNRKGVKQVIGKRIEELKKA